MLLHVARRPVDRSVLAAHDCLARSAAVASLESFCLFRVEVELAVEVRHCDAVGVPTGAKFPRTARLPWLVMTLAKATLVDRKVRLLVNLAHLRLRRDHLVLRVCLGNGIDPGRGLALTVQVSFDRAIDGQLFFSNVCAVDRRVSAHEHSGHRLALLSSSEALQLLWTSCRLCTCVGDGPSVVGQGGLVPTLLIV